MEAVELRGSTKWRAWFSNKEIRINGGPLEPRVRSIVWAEKAFLKQRHPSPVQGLHPTGGVSESLEGPPPVSATAAGPGTPF